MRRFTYVMVASSRPFDVRGGHQVLMAVSPGKDGLAGYKSWFLSSVIVRLKYTLTARTEKQKMLMLWINVKWMNGRGRRIKHESGKG